jgi:predicted MFS family arabinose efflux permease
LTHGFAGLLGCRAVLGAGEAAGIPAAGKAIRQYLRPAERALGNAMNQAGVSLGMVLAPPLATWIAIQAGWRAAFVATGVLGLLWIPIWNWAARRGDPAPVVAAETADIGRLLRDRRLWAFVLANALSMIGYSLWTNWTTLYLVDVHRLTVAQAAWYAWIPPLAATLGGFSRRLAVARLHSPWHASGAWAVPRVPAGERRGAGHGRRARRAHGRLGRRRNFAQHLRRGRFQRQYVYAPARCLLRRARRLRRLLPGGILWRGASRAHVSPAFGRLIDLYGYQPVTAIAAVMPLAASAVLWNTRLDT